MARNGAESLCPTQRRSGKGFKLNSVIQKRFVMSFSNILLPRMVEIPQRLSPLITADHGSAISEELESTGLAEKIGPDARIVINAGSRGIAHYPEILATVVDAVKKAGDEPFLDRNSMRTHRDAVRRLGKPSSLTIDRDEKVQSRLQSR